MFQLISFGLFPLRCPKFVRAHSRENWKCCSPNFSPTSPLPPPHRNK